MYGMGRGYDTNLREHYHYHFSKRVEKCAFKARVYLNFPRIAMPASKVAFQKTKIEDKINLIDPRGRPTATAGSDLCFCICLPFVRPSVPTFQNKTNFKRKLCSLLARLWVWASGSLMTPVLETFNCVALPVVHSMIYSKFTP